MACGPKLLDAQADRLGLRRVTGRCTWQTYDAAFSGALQRGEGGRRHARHLRRHPVRRASRVGGDAVRGAWPDGRRAALRLLHARAVRRMDRLRRRRDHRHRARRVSRRELARAPAAAARCSTSSRGSASTRAASAASTTRPSPTARSSARRSRSFTASASFARGVMRWTRHRPAVFSRQSAV